MSSLFKRDAISRARHFLSMAKECKSVQRDEYEAFLEAAIIFGRTALNRLNTLLKLKQGWRSWFDKQWEDPSVQFFKIERDYLLKEGSTKVGQVIRVGENIQHAEDCYYFESIDISATDTVERHLSRIEEIVAEAHRQFGAGVKR